MSAELEKIALEIICHAGDAKGDAYQALRLARKNKFEEAEEILKKADRTLTKSHKVHMKLICEKHERGSFQEQLLITHAMDTLMTSMSEMNLIKEIVEILKENRR